MLEKNLQKCQKYYKLTELHRKKHYFFLDFRLYKMRVKMINMMANFNALSACPMPEQDHMKIEAWI
jgi:ferritin-like protein